METMEDVSVELLAKRLTSEDLQEQCLACLILRDLVVEIMRERLEKKTTIRLVQNLAAYKHGMVIKKLLTQLQPFSTYPSQEHMIAVRILPLLASSRLAAQFVTQSADLEFLVNTLLGGASFTNPQHTPDSAVIRLHLVLNSIEGFKGFARYSTGFRTAMQRCGSLSQALCNVASDRFAQIPSTFSVSVEEVRSGLCYLLAELTLHADSRAWILSWGWLQIVEEVLKTTTVEDMGTIMGVALYTGLVALFLDTETSKQLKRMGALTILRPYKKLINKGDKRSWDMFEDCISRTSPGSERRSKRPAKRSMKSLMSGIRDLPTLCSWDGCTAGEELSAEKKFKECASCGLAAYCSKEHQKLHWPVHKEDCRYKEPGEQISASAQV